MVEQGAGQKVLQPQEEKEQQWMGWVLGKTQKESQRSDRNEEQRVVGCRRVSRGNTRENL